MGTKDYRDKLRVAAEALGKALDMLMEAHEETEAGSRAGDWCEEAVEKTAEL